MKAIVETDVQLDPMSALSSLMMYNRDGFPEWAAVRALRRSYALTDIGALMLLQRLAESGRLLKVHLEGYEAGYRFVST